MRIILSPAKKMKTDTDSLPISGMPELLPKTEVILQWLRGLSQNSLQALWGCNDKIAQENFARLESMKLTSNLTPAILSYEGIAFQYMAPSVFAITHFEYIQEHLRILSAFYGCLRPMDGVTPYRLEMQAKAQIAGHKNLYDFWGDDLYKAVRDESGVIVNLASKEYSRCVEKYLQPTDRFLTVTFCEESKGKLVTKGTYAKMARGEMVRFMAENSVQEVEGIKDFDRLGYEFREDISTDTEYVFERKVGEKHGFRYSKG